MGGIDHHFERAERLLDRLEPTEAWAETAQGALLVDTRPAYQRAADGEIPGAMIVERNHLEWRLDPSCSARVPEAGAWDLRWIVICDEGCSSVLAALSLREIGLVRATDVIGGFQRWRAEGLSFTSRRTLSPPRLHATDLRIKG
ncbi:rhodanese-like domain-containing protein [Rhizohabitans arisaemae]|uniref:rhodanese-like domain-containing protein n=1 Tax=Rhizohabitans arisaemae TaxID=2720610 RepID=UPI0024B20E4D|nr:rhodanese-like domain-containing protein [Rhizohabitans arisaemae]